MHRQSIRLSDGRELIYFDGEPGRDRSAADQRVLAPPAGGPSLRFDPVVGEWVSVAGHRNDRTFMPSAADCPLCPSGPGAATEIPSPDYDVVVFENRFPSFAGPSGATTSDGLFEQRPAGGRCEVVCFSPRHDASFVDLDVDRVRLVIEAWAERTAALSALDGVEQVFVFENRGEAIGVTLHHPHGQIYAYPFVPPRTRAQLASVERHLADTGRNLYDDVVSTEVAAHSRVVAESDQWVAFVPFAARWPVEVHLYPRQRTPDLATLSDSQRDDLAPIYLDILRRCDRLFGLPLPYVAGWHQAPVCDRRELGALHLELFSVQRAPDKLKYLAASESAMGAFVNDRTPESMADLLRAAGDA